jgi:hypothetical protein
MSIDDQLKQEFKYLYIPYIYISTVYIYIYIYKSIYIYRCIFIYIYIGEASEDGPNIKRSKRKRQQRRLQIMTPKKRSREKSDQWPETRKQPRPSVFMICTWRHSFYEETCRLSV